MWLLDKILYVAHTVFLLDTDGYKENLAEKSGLERKYDSLTPYFLKVENQMTFSTGENRR